MIYSNSSQVLNRRFGIPHRGINGTPYTAFSLRIFVNLRGRKKVPHKKGDSPVEKLLGDLGNCFFFAKKEGRSRQKKAIRKFVKVANGKIGLLDLNSFRHCSQLGVIRLQEHRWRLCRSRRCRVKTRIHCPALSS